MGYRCQMGRCVPNGNLGSPCATSAECSMGTCSGGVCCNMACDGACQSCVLPGRAGMCTPLPQGTQIRDAGAGAVCSCNGVSGTCMQTPDAGAPDVAVIMGMDAAVGVEPIIYRGGGCGCSAPGTPSGHAALGLAAIAMALASARRRRR